MTDDQPEFLGGLPVRTDLRAGLAWDDLDELTPERIRAIIAPIRSGHMIDAERWIAEARAFAEMRSVSV